MFTAAQVSFPVTYSFNPNPARRFRNHLSNFRFVVSSKKWDYQDFRDYAKPTRLFPASKVQVCPAPLMEQTIDSSSTHGFESLYRIKLNTSIMYGSGLTDLNSGVLVCVIDENSNSILVRLPACTASIDATTPSEDVIHFQRGSVDEFVFKGPDLGNIEAIWISVESGQWRLGSMSLIVIRQQRPPLQYNLDTEDVMVGEKSDFPMIQCKPCSVTEFSDFTLSDIDDISKSSSSSSSSINPSSMTSSKEEAMKEYTDLKLSILFYDTILVLSGTIFASIPTGKRDVAIAFLTGGVGGFLYLLLLQRSVDTLPSKDLFPGQDGFIGKLKGLFVILVIAFFVGIVGAKYVLGDGKMLEPEEVIFGMVGFIMCKISVVLAAFKPLPLGLKNIDK